MPRSAARILCLFVAAGLLAGCGDEQTAVLKSKFGKVVPESKKDPAAPDGGWTPEKIAKDPAGYLQYANGRVASQIQGREHKLAQLSAQRADVAARSDALAGKVSDAQNIIKRMKSAMQRADDENNWPVKIAGRSFDAGKADAVIKSLEQFIADRQTLVAAYADAVNRITSTESTLRADIENLTRMREKVGLDLERIRLNQGLQELGDLQKTENEIASFAKTLADMSDDANMSRLMLPVKTNEALSAESLLK